MESKDIVTHNVIRTHTYFNTFDAIRFFAFFKVFIFHIPIIGYPIFDFIKQGGGTAVSLFFSLSGFLITYLILEEKHSTGIFNLKDFYVRRMLRIWPMYYCMVLFAFLTPYILSIISIKGNGEGYEPNWFMSVAFLENYKMIFTNDFPNVSPLGVMWSLCVEEHFYIIWGLLLYFISARNIHWVIIGAIIVANGCRYIFYLNGWSFLDVFTNLDYFAYGAIPALLLVRKKEIITKALASILSIYKVLVMIFVAILFFSLPNLDFQSQALIEPTILGILFSVVLIFIVFEERLFMISKKNIFSRLGIYTYSLYLTHTIIINLFVKIFERMNLSFIQPFVAFGFVSLCLLITIIASMITYYVIEKPFLMIKNRIKKNNLYV